jgi:hypothetical protein
VSRGAGYGPTTAGRPGLGPVNGNSCGLRGPRCAKSADCASCQPDESARQVDLRQARAASAVALRAQRGEGLRSVPSLAGCRRCRVGEGGGSDRLPGHDVTARVTKRTVGVHFVTHAVTRVPRGTGVGPETVSARLMKFPRGGRNVSRASTLTPVRRSPRRPDHAAQAANARAERHPGPAPAYSTRVRKSPTGEDNVDAAGQPKTPELSALLLGSEAERTGQFLSSMEMLNRPRPVWAAAQSALGRTCDRLVPHSGTQRSQVCR